MLEKTNPGDRGGPTEYQGRAKANRQQCARWPRPGGRRVGLDLEGADPEVSRAFGDGASLSAVLVGDDGWPHD